MKGRYWLLAAAASFALALAGCGSDSGGTSGNGGGGGTTPPPATTPTVAAPTGKNAIRLDANTPAATFAALKPVVNVGGVSINNGPPVVAFSIADQANNPIIGFFQGSKSATATVTSYPNLTISMLKLIPGSNGSPSHWVNYMVTAPATTTAPVSIGRHPTSENYGTIVDNGDGTYLYTFWHDVTQMKAQVAALPVCSGCNVADLGDLSYDPTLVHRLMLTIGGAAPGTGTNTPTGAQTTTAVNMQNPVNAFYDFVPATGKLATADQERIIVSTDACNQCHNRLGGTVDASGAASPAAFHGGKYADARMCTVCHNDQLRYGQSEATANGLTFTSKSVDIVDGRSVYNYPNWVHKIHMGNLLTMQNYTSGGLPLNEVTYPQDIRNCTTCHSGAVASTPQGDNWKNVPSRLACGSCHDGIDFATGKGTTIAGLTTGHIGGAQADDSLCALCHKPDYIDTYHTPITPANPSGFGTGSAHTNIAAIASNLTRLPAGAIKVSYDVKSVAVTSDNHPQITFRLLQNGQAKAFNDPTTSAELWDGFIGSPSLQFVWAVPQDGIAKPADFNMSASAYLKGLWKGTATGTLTGPDGSGYYTATLTGTTLSSSAHMLTGGLGFGYGTSTTSQPLTQVNLADFPATTVALSGGASQVQGGLIVLTPTVQMAASASDARRVIVDNAKCNACHQRLGPFTEEAFHAGQRNDGTTCSWCHNPNRSNNGWSIDSTTFIHAIHGGSKRGMNFTYQASATNPAGFGDVTYPGIVNNCDQCHVPNTYNFGVAANQAQAGNRLYRTAAAGTVSASASMPGYSYVTAGSYASAPSYSSATGAMTSNETSTSYTLVSSPTAAACFSCHDSANAVGHMRSNGGSIYAPRAQAVATQEGCLVCHGAGSVYDVKLMHTATPQ